jgi:hypothetical protein
MYQAYWENGTYVASADGKTLFTPAGNAVTTTSEPLSKLLIRHLAEFGPDNGNWLSIIHFHYPMLDFVRQYPRQSVILHLMLGLDPFNDWTFKAPPVGTAHSERWIPVFGEATERIKVGRIWMDGLNENQLCAVMVLGKDMKSINVAYLAARSSGEDELRSLAANLRVFKPELLGFPLEELLDNFNFYWQLNCS